MERLQLPQLPEVVLKALGRVAQGILGTGMCMIGEFNEGWIEEREHERANSTN